MTKMKSRKVFSRVEVRWRKNVMRRRIIDEISQEDSSSRLSDLLNGLDQLL